MMMRLAFGRRLVAARPARSLASARTHAGLRRSACFSSSEPPHRARSCRPIEAHVMPLATLPHDAIQRILYATTPSEWKSVARQACVLRCVCTDLRVAVETWARSVANAMRYRRGPDPRMPWTLASSTLRGGGGTSGAPHSRTGTK